MITNNRKFLLPLGRRWGLWRSGEEKNVEESRIKRGRIKWTSSAVEVGSLWHTLVFHLLTRTLYYLINKINKILCSMKPSLSLVTFSFSIFHDCCQLSIYLAITASPPAKFINEPGPMIHNVRVHAVTPWTCVLITWVLSSLAAGIIDQTLKLDGLNNWTHKPRQELVA